VRVIGALIAASATLPFSNSTVWKTILEEIAKCEVRCALDQGG
jgi:hypothetical protein